MNDFNGDGLSDILWRNTANGQTQVTISNTQGNIDRIEYQWKLRNADWAAEGIADFNNDGFTDTLWRNTINGQTQVSISNNQGNIERIEYQWKLRDSDWNAEGVADFNGDGLADTLWRNTTSGQTQVSISNTLGNIDHIEYQWKLRNADWIAEGVGDFNGDGNADTLWRNSVSGQTQVSISNSHGNIERIEYQWKLRNSDWNAEGIADFNGDNFADVLWRNTLSGQTQVSISNAQGNIDRIEYQWKLRDSTWNAEGVGDFNGDGLADALWRNTASGQTQVSVSNSLGNIDRIEYQWKLRNTDWKAEGSADFNGDGFTDTLWRNTANGQTQISISNNLGNIDRIEYQWKIRDNSWEYIR
jgi:limonene-1,2-epoxide hydrolase